MVYNPVLYVDCVRLSEARAAKQKLSRQVRDKEEEIDTLRQKSDGLRQELRKADKTKREVGD